MGVNTSGLSADLKTSFDKPPESTDESTTDIAQAISDNVDAVGSPEAVTKVSTFSNSWENFGGDYETAGYYKDGAGRVHLEGLIRNGSVGSPAFTLDAGYRPANRHIFGTASGGSIGRLDILANGDVQPQSPSISSWVTLSGISFRSSE